ncbi:T9SS type A sorting domain-containing protein, partial [Pseudoflavitalea sp. X16]|uniref:YDG domain-containing protein n=1 Tax=Paraflavitalea devenefica TaxID=2716334 RepID=UPI00141DFE34
QVYDTRNVGTNKTLTASGLVINDGNGGNNYTVTYATNTAGVISARDIHVTAQSDNRIYNGTTSSAVAPVVDPLQTGDVIGTAPTQVYDTRNVGTGKTLTASGLVINDGNSGNNYNILYAPDNTGVISARDIHVTAQTDSRVYNGTTSSAIAPVVESLQTGDAIGTAPTQVFDTRNVGTNKSLIASGLMISDGNSGNNYNILYSPDNTGVISARDIHVTAQSDNRIYNGTTSSAVAPVVDPVQTGDAIGTVPTQVYDTRNVGTGKILTASGLVINDGNSGNNYNVLYNPDNTGVISVRDIHVTAQPDNRIYNGTTSSAVAPVVDPLQTGDAIGTAPTQEYDTRNVGTNKTLTVSGLVINDGNGGNNYNILYAPDNAGVISVRDIHVTAQTDSRIYNGTTSSAIAPAVDPLQAGDAIGTAPTQVYDTRNVGTGKTLTASGLVINDGNSGNNYNVLYNPDNTGVISARDIHVAAQPDNRVYNGTTSSGVAPAVDPLQTGDAIGTAPTQEYDTRNVGTNKTLTASGLVINDGNGGNNYNILYSPDNTGVISARDIHVTAQTDSRVYNGTTSSAVAPVVDALQTGDAIGTAPTQTFNTKHAGINKTLIASGLVINDGNGGNNYSIHYLTNTTGIITAKDIHVTAQHDDRIYNGTTSSGVAPVVEALQTGDLIGTPPIQKYDTKNVGVNKTLTPYGLVVNDGNSGLNYSIHYLTDLTGIISAKAITGNVTVANKAYDGTTSATIATRTLIGAIGTDIVSYSGGTATFDDVPAGTGKNVGNNKPVTATGLYLTGADAGNYTVNSSATTTANITQKGLCITADNLSPQYSDPVSFTVNYAGFVPGEGPGNLAGSLTFATTPAATTGTNPVIATGAPGAYTITPGGLTSSNYIITFKTGVLTIRKEDAKITYTGSTLVATTGTATTATLTLSATIQDITAALADPAYDTYPGDIRKATITFNIDGIDRATVPIGLINSADTKTGTVVYNFTGAGLGDHTIILKLNGYYTSTTSGDNQLVVEVYQATGDFITGGGYLKLTNSSGLKAGDAGTKNNFGFNIKYNKSGTNLQGHINTIVRRMEAGIMRVYQIKGNSMTSLTVNATATPRTAVFNGKANITDITNPSSPAPVSGNSTLQVSMTDAGEPGTNDKIGIVVYNNTGGVWFSSNWDGTKTVQQTLGGGNLIVHSNNNVGISTATSVRTATVTTDQTPTSSLSDKFSVKVYPTVSKNYFTVNVQSNTADVVEIKVYDIIGKQVEIARGGIGASIRVGTNLASGTYILKIRQGKNNETIRVSKLY